jgi:hypothetical protein
MLRKSVLDPETRKIPFKSRYTMSSNPSDLSSVRDRLFSNSRASRCIADLCLRSTVVSQKQDPNEGQEGFATSLIVTTEYDGKSKLLSLAKWDYHVNTDLLCWSGGVTSENEVFVRV